MNPRRRRLLVTLTVALLAFATMLAALYHWWYWYRFTDFANLVERSRIDLPNVADAVLSPDGSRMFIVHEPERGQGYVRIFDTATDTRVDSVQLQPGFPVSLAVTPDGRRLLVGVSRYRGGSSGGTMGENRVDLVDIVTRTVVGKVPIDGRCASFVAVAEDGKSAYVSERTSHFVDHIDLAANRVVEKIRVPTGPYTVVPKKGSDLAYVVSVRGGDRTLVSVVDTGSDTVVATVSTDLMREAHPPEASFSRDQERLYVIHPPDSRIAVIDTDPGSATYHQQVDLIDTPAERAWRMCFNPETTLAWVLIEPWELTLLDTNPESPRYHTIVDRRPIGYRGRFLLHAPQGETMKLYIFDESHELVRVFAPKGK